MKTYWLQDDIGAIARGLGDGAQRLAGRSVLLCGGAGFLGRYFSGLVHHLNEHVLERPARLTVLDNFIVGAHDGSMPAGFPRSPHLKFIHHDVTRPIEIDGPLDFIVHAAGIASPYYYRKYPLETLEVATTGTRRTLELGVEHGVEGYLFFSSSEIYGDPDPAHVPTPESYRGNVSCLGPRACYDEAKRLGETLCAVYHETRGAPARIVRPFNVYGPGMEATDYRVMPNFARSVVHGQPLAVYGTGRQTRSFCYVVDAMIGFVKVLLDGTAGQPYNIGNPDPEIAMHELVEVFAKAAGRPLERKSIEHPDSYPPDEPMRRCPDISKARLQLDYAPRVSLDEGVGRFLDWAAASYPT
jgi:UDP-glucuronate decarboxylase